MMIDIYYDCCDFDHLRKDNDDEDVCMHMFYI